MIKVFPYFLSFLYEFGFEGYLHIIMNIKKKKWCVYFICIGSSLVIILLPDKAQPFVARTTLEKLTELGYETLPHPPFSPDLSPIDNIFFKQVDTILSQKHSLPKKK